jgi:DNA-binding response OmpR family regulator
VILDVMLPDQDGFEVCRQITAASTVPVLMLTARGDDTDRIVGLELGADDYLPKPFNPRELVARLGAVLRRSRRAVPDAPDLLRFGDLEIDRAAREVRVSGARRELTGRQFDLLVLLAERAGRVQSREQILDALKGEEWDDTDRTIDVHISRIRAAIEDDPRSPRIVQTVRGVGYVFAPPAPHVGGAGPGGGGEI